MRKLLLTLIAALAATGLALVPVDVGEGAPGWRKAVALAHIWGGFFFLVIFPLYAWDHVRKHQAWLRFVAGVTVTGVTQLTGGILLLLSGVVLLAYQSQAGGTVRWLHHLLTYLLVAALAGHFLSKKA
jgi:hypothetical protein